MKQSSPQHKNRAIHKRYMLVIPLMLLFLIIAALYYFAFGIIVASYRIPVDFEVSYKTGITGDTDALHFGVVRQGSWSKKSIIISNRNPFPVQVVMIPYGNVSPYIVLPENYFYINTSVNRSVDVWVQTSETIPHGMYVGDLQIILKK